MKTIETPRLLLRPVVEGDAGDLFACCKHSDVGPAAGWKPHATIDETREVMQAVFLGEDNLFAVVLKETRRLIGSVGLVPDHKRQYDRARMIGYAIGADHWGRGYMTEAVGAMLRFAFDELGMELVSAYCYPFNERSRRVLLKCGFVYEGTLHAAEKRFDGALLDNECYSVRRDAVRQN